MVFCTVPFTRVPLTKVPPTIVEFTRLTWYEYEMEKLYAQTAGGMGGVTLEFSAKTLWKYLGNFQEKIWRTGSIERKKLETGAILVKICGSRGKNSKKKQINFSENSRDEKGGGVSG